MSKMDIENVVYWIDAEGLDYFLLTYTSADEMPTDELARKFREAEAALKAFVEAVNAEARKAGCRELGWLE